MGVTVRAPIAIIGAGCRFPGADGVEEFWQLLCRGADSISHVPPARWDQQALCAQHRDLPELQRCGRGGFIPDGDAFDAPFFDISAAEARRMDPQQGLVLETVWQALEYGALAPQRLRGSCTGVFIGVSTSDFDRRLCRDIRNLDVLAGTGTSYSVIANRVSYLLGLSGPSVAVDLACSSSLYAIHLACQSLWLRESSLALAGGVHLILSPEKTATFARGKLLAPDGRCKSFSSAADGYVRGEGCGIVVLKPLADAQRARDPILAVLRGSSANHNGRSNGLSSLCGTPQRSLIDSALRAGGVEPRSIGYVEAHGTGTSLGDIIEVTAIKSALSRERPSDHPCLIGSVKPNIGHLEGASGVASLIKSVLAVREGWIPPTLYATPLNPELRLEGSSFSVASAAQAWPPLPGPRRAAVSTFSFGGANVHVVLEQAPPSSRASSGAAAHLLPISARTPEALFALVERYVWHLSKLIGAGASQQRFADLCYTAAVGRQHFAHRAFVIATGPGEAKELLLRDVLTQAEAATDAGQGVRRRTEKVVYAVHGVCRTASRSRHSVPRSLQRAVRFLDRCGVRPDIMLGVGQEGTALARSLSGGWKIRAADDRDARAPPQILSLQTEQDPWQVLRDARGPGAGMPNPLSLLVMTIGAGPAALNWGEGVRSLMLRDWGPRSNDLLRSIGAAYVWGLAINWHAVFQGRARLCGLPCYPFERKRHWTDAPGKPDLQMSRDHADRALRQEMV